MLCGSCRRILHRAGSYDLR
ncbi:MAG: hypothetical protein E7460_05340 [Ruminococcaceae bacterium]|nr:hypothetical protein [Oscillospiraceae bacterium]